MKPGYLRRNGDTYSADAVITEYLDRLDLPGDGALLVVTTEIVDPISLLAVLDDQEVQAAG